jgi:hypothetical protein
MIELQRYIRPGVVVSAIGHIALVVLGLQLVGANSHESVPPDAMVVDIVPPDEAPRFSGTPSNLRTSGSESASPSNAGNAAAQSPPPKPAAPPPQQPQKRPDPQRDARQAAAQAQTPPPPAPHAEMAQPQTANAQTAETETPATQASEPPPVPPSEHAQESQDEPGAADLLARLALAGGRLGGGFPAPPIDASFAGYDFTTPFRERVSSCSALPAGIEARDKVSLKVRVSLNPDGTLASPPQALEPVMSWKQQALMQSASDALQRCQPYTMLPAEKYKQWKTLDLVIVPTSLLGG